MTSDAALVADRVMRPLCLRSDVPSLSCGFVAFCKQFRARVA